VTLSALREAARTVEEQLAGLADQDPQDAGR